MSQFLTRRHLAGLRSAKWAATLTAYEVTVVESLPARPPLHSILVTGCSRKKRTVPTYPQFLYLGSTIHRAFKYADQRQWPFGVLSDRHGICFDTDVVEPYDTSPASLSEQELWDLGAIIRGRLDERGFRRVHYVGGPPSMTLPYMLMLLAAGLPVIYCPLLAPPARGKPRSLLDHV